MLSIIIAIVIAGVLGSFTDWLFMGVLFHDAYNRYPEIWRPGVRDGKSQGAIIASSALGFVFTAAVVASCNMNISGTLAPSWPSGWITEEMPMLDWPKIVAILASTPGRSITLSRTKYGETTSSIEATQPVQACGTNASSRFFTPAFKSSTASPISLSTALAVASLPAPRP